MYFTFYLEWFLVGDKSIFHDFLSPKLQYNIVIIIFHIFSYKPLFSTIIFIISVRILLTQKLPNQIFYLIICSTKIVDPHLKKKEV